MHTRTIRQKDELKTAGGGAVDISAVTDTLAEAMTTAYKGSGSNQVLSMWYRTNIAFRYGGRCTPSIRQGDLGR